MKAKIHPQYFKNAEVVCACGNRFNLGSTLEVIHVELCDKCHPFYTGEERFIDTLGRVERFKQKEDLAKKQAPLLVRQKAKKGKKPGMEEERAPRTLKEMLQSTQK